MKLSDFLIREEEIEDYEEKNPDIRVEFVEPDHRSKMLIVGNDQNDPTYITLSDNGGKKIYFNKVGLDKLIAALKKASDRGVRSPVDPDDNDD